MSDDLNDLKQALQATTPTPEAARKAEHLMLAEKNFERLQETTKPHRHTFRQSDDGHFKGVKKMMSMLSNRMALGTATALACAGLIAVFPEISAQFGDQKHTNAVIDPHAMVQSSPETAPNTSTKTDTIIASDMQKLELSEAGVDSDHIMPLSRPAASMRSRLLQETRDIRPLELKSNPSGDVFATAPQNPLRVTVEHPVSTFSVDVDTAAYAYIRSALQAGQLPPKEAVRIEEMINYFQYDYTDPDEHPGGDAAFHTDVTVTQTPWNAETQLVRIALQGKMPETDQRPPLNLVFLIDTSGSMDQPDKLPLLIQSFRLMLGQLRATDEIAIVTYAGNAGQVLEPTSAAEKTSILGALARLQAGGSTHGQAGLQLAYRTASQMATAQEVTRIILATDGDFNLGLSDSKQLKDYIAQQRDSGIYLSVLGFGRGNLNDATLQTLAQNGNGQAAYIDTLSEAQKVLNDQLTGALFPIANDVKIQVEFNPAKISEYRLIGYETRALKREDFNNDKVDAGDIGAGHQVTALYEVTPVGSPARLTSPLRYGNRQDTMTPGEIGFVALRYKQPGSTQSQRVETPITQDNIGDDDDLRFAAAIAGFGQLLRDPRYLGNWGWNAAIDLADNARGADQFGYRAAAVTLMRLAQSLNTK